MNLGQNDLIKVSVIKAGQERPGVPAENPAEEPVHVPRPDEQPPVRRETPKPERRVEPAEPDRKREPERVE